MAGGGSGVGVTYSRSRWQRSQRLSFRLCTTLQMQRCACVGGVVAWWCEQMAILTRLTNNGRRRIWGWCDVLPQLLPVQSVAQFSPVQDAADAKDVRACCSWRYRMVV
jgi:hypothetical protein